MDTDDLHDDLDAYAFGDDGEIPEEPIAPPVDEERAQRMLRARHHLQRELGKIRTVANAEMSRIAAWSDDRSAGITKRIASLDGALEGYMRMLAAREPRRRSMSLPHGTLKLRAPGKATVVITDEAAFLLWAAGQPDPSKWVKNAPTPVKAEIGKAVQGPAESDEVVDGVAYKQWIAVVDGEPIPGVLLRKPAADTFNITDVKESEPEQE